MIITPIGTEKEIDANDLIRKFSIPRNFFYDEQEESSDKQAEDLEDYEAYDDTRRDFDRSWRTRRGFERSVRTEHEQTLKRKTPLKPIIKRSHHKKELKEASSVQREQTIEDIEYNDGLIKFNKEELIEFIEKLGIENNTNGILVQLAPLYNSPFSKSFLIDSISEWYEQE